MSDLKRIWRLTLPIAILALLLGTTLGMVWHHHQTESSADTCPICHLSHVVIEPIVADIQVHAPVPIGDALEQQLVRFAPNLFPRDVPARGPPA
jgi:hypothetical protein